MSTAASRVFDLPELLENILFFLGHQERAVSPKYFEPPVSLFAFQRVNSTFHAIIARSKRLRVLMMLDHEKDDVVDTMFRTPETRHPIWWLLKCSPNSHLDGNRQTFTLGLNIHTEVLFVHWRRKILSTPRAADAADAKASWRDIKLTPHSPDNIRAPKLRIDVQTGENYNDYQMYDVLLEEHGTLGNLYDFFNHVMNRELNELRLLSHIFNNHGIYYNRKWLYTLQSGEPLHTDVVLADYYAYKREEEDEHPPGWQAEEWGEPKLGNSGGPTAILKTCAYCYKEESDEVFDR